MTERRQILDGDERLSSTDQLPKGPPNSPTPAVVRQGARIGRYLILDELGAGTMGVVYAAYDPELDRKVAIKLLKSRRDEQLASRQRLQREAQALAKLDHRNVVGVYDVGVHEGQLWLAMEFVEGQTLRMWMNTGRRKWAEVLRVLLEAGRGLAAAHGVGFVHRDFKPDNVMIHQSGRVRVMDFGLARAEIHEDDKTEPDASLGRAPIDQLGHFRTIGTDHLTETGTVMGTPAYMARELFDGQPADARSDQFAFCVTLYEALYGERPFAGTKVSRLIRAVAEGRVSEPSRDAKVPLWLRAIVVRGLSPDPAARWPSMIDLLEALEQGPRRRRRRALCMAGALLCTFASAYLAGRVWQSARMCAGVGDEVEQVWTEMRRAELEARFEASEQPYAGDAWRRVGLGLDDYAAAWAAARVDACEAARAGEQSVDQRALRDTCLDDRLTHLRATIEVLAEADASIIGRAVEMISELPRIERCADIDALEIDAPPVDYASGAQQVIALEQRLVEAEALERAGKYRAALFVTAEIIDAASELHDERLLARARLREGVLQRHAGDYDAAETALIDAYERASGLRMTAEAAEAAATLVFVIGYQLARVDEGRQWALHARPLARAAGTDEAVALYLNNIGAVAYEAGQYDEAREAWAEALVIRERALGPEHPKVAGSLNNLGVVAIAEGEYERARTYHQRALEIWTNAHGGEHPQTSYSLNHLGRVALEQGRYVDARELYERALAIRERALGPAHTLVADTLANLGSLAEREGDPTRALEFHTRAVAIYEAALGPDHPRAANASTDRANVLLELGRADEAIAALERSLGIQRHVERDPTQLAKTRFTLARALDALDAPDSPDPARAHDLAVLARQAYVDAGRKSARELAAVDAWLVARQ